jgi:hypothetical protein
MSKVKQKLLIVLGLSFLLAGWPADGFAQKGKPKSRTRRAKTVKAAPPTVSAIPAEAKEEPLPPVKITPASPDAIVARSALLSALPASDAVMYLDLKRILNDALPVVMAGDKARLAKLNGQFDRLKQQTGLDVRSFERLALGFRAVPSGGGYNLVPFGLVNGSFNAGSLIALGRFAAEGKYKQEEYKGKQIYLFNIGDALKDIPALNTLGAELAVTEIDANTLALGTPASLKESLDKGGDTPRVSAELVQLATRNPDALIGFGMNIPTDAFAGMIDTQNDEIGKTVASIRQAGGSVSLNDTGAELALAARAGSAADAKNLTDTLNALKDFGGLAIGGLKNPAQQKLALSALQTLKITYDGNESQLSLAIKRSDFPALLGLIK